MRQAGAPWQAYVNSRLPRCTTKACLRDRLAPELAAQRLALNGYNAQIAKADTQLGAFHDAGLKVLVGDYDHAMQQVGTSAGDQLSAWDKSVTSHKPVSRATLGVLLKRQAAVVNAAQHADYLLNFGLYKAATPTLRPTVLKLYLDAVRPLGWHAARLANTTPTPTGP